MKLAKYFLLFAISIALIACSKGDDDPQQNEEPQPEKDTPVKVEPLPEGVKLKDETIQLNNIQLSKITSVDEENTTLTFDASTPQDQIPQKGQILLQFSPTKELPYGFIGRVTDVKESNGKIVVETEAPALNEAFDELVINYDSRNAYISSRADEDEDEQDEDIENEISVDEEGYINFTTTYTSKNPDVSLSVGFGLNASVKIDLNNKENKNDQLYGFGVRTSIVTKYSDSIEKEYQQRRDMGKGIKFTIPQLSPAIVGAVQFSWATEAKGEFSFDLTQSISTNDLYYVESKGNSMPKFAQANEGGNPSVDVMCSPELKLSGEMWIGLGMRIELRLFGRKDLSVGIGSEVGPQISSEIDLLSDNTNIYTKHKDTAIELTGVLKNKAYSNAKLLGYKEEWEKELSIIEFHIAKKYLFPGFEDLSLEEGSTTYCRATVSRDLLFPLDIGFSQYDDNEELVQHSKEERYYSPENFANPLQAKFSSDPAKDYTYWTYVKLGNEYIKCERVQPSILGKWQLVNHKSIEYDGTREYVNSNNGEIDGTIWDFRENGIGVYNYLYYGKISSSENFKYTYNGETLSIYYDNWEGLGNSKTFNYQILDISNDKLEVYRSEDGLEEWESYIKITDN